MKKLVTCLGNSLRKSIKDNMANSTTGHKECISDESVIVSSFQSEATSHNDRSLSMNRSKMVQVEGDIQPSSSSHVDSENWSRTDASLSVLSAPQRQNSLDEFFVTPSLPFPYDEDKSEDYDLRISEEYDLRSKNVANKHSIASLDSHDVVQMEKENAKMVGPKSNADKESSEEEDEASYFPTARVPSDSAAPNPNRERKVEDCTNDVANKTTVAQVEPEPAPRKYPTKTVKVFITYALEPENENHMKSVASMATHFAQVEYLYKGPTAETLFKFEVIVDVFDKEIEAQSKSIWLERHMKEANFVLVCISPSYSNLVELTDESKDCKKEQNETDFENSVHTQYIYRRMHSEYINNGSKNIRFIPVLFSGASRDNVPNWLRDTLLYRWSSDYKQLIFRLISKEEHLKPTPGSLPELQIRSRFQDCNGSDKKRT